MSTELLTTAMPLAQMGRAPQGNPAMMIGGYAILIIALFYVMIIAPQRKRDKERKALVDQTKTGDRVIFSGGIIGTISNVKEYTFVVKVGDRVKMEILRTAVQRVLQKDDDLAATADEQQ